MKNETKILIVEDEIIAARDVQNRLESAGYTVLAVALSGEEALERTAQTEPDLVLMDIRLGGELNSIETTEQIHARLDVPVVYLTAYADDETLQRAKVSEPFGYIVKPFTERELRSTVEMALYRHEMERKLRQRTGQLEALQGISLAITAQLELDKLLQEIVEQGCRLLGVPGASLYLVDETERDLELAVNRGYTPVRTGTRLAPGEGIAGKVLETGEAVRVDDYTHWDGRSPDWKDEGITGSLCVPLKLGGRVIGTLGFEEIGQPRSFDEQDAWLATLFANQAAIAIGNARLYEEQSQRAAELSVLYDVTTAAMTPVDLDEVLDRAVDALRDTLQPELDVVAILLVEPGEPEDELVVRASTGFPGGPTLMRRSISEGIPGSVVQSGRPALVPDVRADERYHACAPETRSELCVPLQIGDRVIGALNLESHRLAAFDEEDLRLVSILAGHLAAVIENAQLFDHARQEIAQRKRAEEELRDRERFLALLNDVTNAALETSDLPTMLQTLADRLGDLFRAAGCYLTLWDEETETVRPTAAYGEWRGKYPSVSAKPGEVTMTASILRAESPLAVEDVYDTPHLSERIAEMFPDRSLLGLPLIAGEEKLGAALIAFNEPHAFTEREIARGEQVARQIALAMAKAKLVTELEASEARYRDIFESVGVPLYEEDYSAVIAALDDLKAQGVQDFRRYLNDHPEFVSRAAQMIRIVDVNRATLEMLGAESKTDVLGALETVIVPETLEKLSDHLVTVAEGQLFLEGETVNRTLQGELRHVLLTAAIPSRAEGFERVVVSSVDVTERRELEEKLRQQEKLAAIGQLAGGIAHDFNTLLTAISITAELELYRSGLLPRTRKALETILTESRRAANLVQQILDFSRSAMVDPRPVSLVALVGDGTTEGAAALLRRTIPEHIEIVTELSSHPCVVRADPTRIHQALMNLASNARDAMPDGGELQISVFPTAFSPEEEQPLPDMPAGAWACLSVADTGTGMSEEAQAHLFEPFFTTKEVGKGTGLGLAQAHGIVKQHEGHIDIDTAAGRGTTVTIYLPLAESPEEEPTADPEDRATDGGGETILVVEDAGPLQRAIESALESLGYRVIVASTGREALERVALEEVDLVLTDVVMPEMGGKALLRELEARAPGLKVVAMTGHVMDKDVEALQAAGFASGLLKPFSIDELLTVVSETLGSNDA